MPLDRPIPAFYCCYLLRSTVKTSSVYVGSTPNPVRRIRQHNGLAKGGAVRTSRPSWRPWEMTCIVTGFPSHIAALQFEWAWQNPHITLRIASEDRLQNATGTKLSGQPRRPRHSVTSLLSNLHLLLRVPSFSRWPLEIRFFCPNVYKSWLRWTKAAANSVRDSIPIVTDFPPDAEAVDGQDGSPKVKRRKTDYGIQALVVDYADQKAQVEKAKDVIEFEREGNCAVCHKNLEHGGGIYAICSNTGCESVTHLTCLSKHFLKGEKEALVPIEGACPSCKAELRWIDVVKELTLRMRGQKQVESLLRVKRVRKGKGTVSQAIVDSDIDEDDDDLVLSDEEWDEIQRMHELDPKAKMEGDRWHAAESNEDSDTGSITSTASQTMKGMHGSKEGGLEMVIEDSDWDAAEILD